MRAAYNESMKFLKAKKQVEDIEELPAIKEGGLREMSQTPDDELVRLLESGAITDDMISELPQNHIVRQRLMMIQKAIKKQLAGPVGLKEFRGNLMGALRWSSNFEIGISKADALKMAVKLSDRVRDAQIIMSMKAAGEQLMVAVQGPKMPVPAPAKPAPAKAAPALGNIPLMESKADRVRAQQQEAENQEQTKSG